MAGAGVLTLGEERFELSGYGLRDHSWGPRYWQNIAWYRWLPMNFGRDFAMMLSIVTRPDGQQRMGGMVLENGAYTLLREVSIACRNMTRTIAKRACAASPAPKIEEYVVTGEVMSLIPLRNRRTPDRSPL